MNKVFLYYIFVLSLCSNLFAQNVSNPPSVDLLKYRNGDGRLYGFPDVQIWGWSRTGKVAYSISTYVEGRGGTITKFIIFNFIDDVILWQNHIDSYDYQVGDIKENYNDAYNNFSIGFRDICKQNNIEFVQIEFKDLPIKHNGQMVDVFVEKKEKQVDPDLRYVGTIESYRIIVGNQGKKKIVHENNFSTVAIDVFVCGYFISPFENRALLVIGEQKRSWEGEEGSFVFIGCHLSYGYE